MADDVQRQNRVLIVDDMIKNVQLVASFLQQENYQIAFALSGEAALQKAKTGQFDLILLDIMMPLMDGFTVCERLKNDQLTKDIPIIFLTAKSDTESIVKGFQLGAVDYIAKPFNGVELLARVKTHLLLKHSAETLRNLNATLEQKVADKVLELRQQEQLLIQQSKMASMGEMIGVIAHQWKQPLNVISIVIQDLKDAFQFDELTEDYLNHSIQKTMNQIEFMSKTIDDFRRFFVPSKIKTRFDAKQAIKEILSMFSVLFNKAQIHVTLEVENDETEFPTVGYPNEFKQALLNIINNAIEAIEFARKTLSEKAGLIQIALTKNASHIQISVRDNGGGISEYAMEKIFCPYFTTKPHNSGTGIGLYMAKTIIENHMNGKLTAHNIDIGAEFVIELELQNV